MQKVINNKISFPIEDFTTLILKVKLKVNFEEVKV